MERLWTPWRYDYVSGAKRNSYPGVPATLAAWVESEVELGDCVFCNMISAVNYAISQGRPSEQIEKTVHLLVRAHHFFLCLNAFPYSTGHILIVPYRHTDSLAALSTQEANEMIRLAQRVESVLRAVYKPSGLNFGLNLGEAAGAGIAGHIHMHALPRWAGDTNFMTATADTRVLPEALDTTWSRIRKAWSENSPELDDGSYPHSVEK